MLHRLSRWLLVTILAALLLGAQCSPMEAIPASRPTVVVTWFQALLQGELVNRGGCVGVANDGYFTILAWPPYFQVDSDATGIWIIKLPYMDKDGNRVWIGIEDWVREEWRIDFGQTVKIGGGFVKLDGLDAETRRSIPEHCEIDAIWLVSPEIELPDSR